MTAGVSPRHSSAGCSQVSMSITGWNYALVNLQVWVWELRGGPAHMAPLSIALVRVLCGGPNPTILLDIALVGTFCGSPAPIAVL